MNVAIDDVVVSAEEWDMQAKINEAISLFEEDEYEEDE